MNVNLTRVRMEPPVYTGSISTHVSVNLDGQVSFVKQTLMNAALTHVRMVPHALTWSMVTSARKLA